MKTARVTHVYPSSALVHGYVDVEFVYHSGHAAAFALTVEQAVILQKQLADVLKLRISDKVE